VVSGGCWFAVLPDCAVAARLGPYVCRVVGHASGRPWLVGCWSDEQLTMVAAGQVRVALAGCWSLSGADLTARVRAVRSVADVESVAHGVAGSFHVLGSVAGRVYGRGSASGSRRLYRARVAGVTVVADRARTLAWLVGAELDITQLAARLVVPVLPWPVDELAMWRGVHTVVPGQAVYLEPDGAHRSRVWWQPPAVELSVAEGAVALGEALREAVAVRVRPGQVWGVDLSGGMDSTSVCFLAAQAGARLVAVTLHWAAAGNEDHRYADWAAQQLPGITHLRFPAGALPGHFRGMDQPQEPGDEPTVLLRDRAQQEHLAAAMRAHGATARLGGHGGDHLVIPPVGYLRALVRRHPLMGLRQAAGYRARFRWSLPATVGMLLDQRGYRGWVRTQARAIQATHYDSTMPPGWGMPVGLPPWASDHSAELVSGLLHSAAEQIEPTAAQRGQHAWIHQIRQAGRIAGYLERATSRAGLLKHSPFCDDTVLNACLAIRPHEASTPWSYKPLLSAAMHDVVPQQILQRSTKDHSGVEWYAGLAAHQPTLAAWADDSHLVAAGVADADQLRRALLSPGLLTSSAAELEYTLGAEAWLRT
jgi:asparagine synthase (glutamine-hydrolysing)